jgi:glycosyltransferase involved in cell wall biosynthesis
MHPVPPFFSIIIPTYNRAAIIHESVQSILAQTFQDWELIVVDDGSSDGTSKIIRQFSETDTRIRYVFQENAERSNARNNGAAHAKGTYLIFLDSDDSFAPEHLEKLQNFIVAKSRPVALFFTNVCYLTDTGLQKPDLPNMNPEKSFEFMLYNPISTSRICMHHEIIHSFKFDPKINIGEDQVLWVSIASKFPVYHLPEYTCNWRIHLDNTVSLSKNPYIGRMQALSRLFYDQDYAEVSIKIPRKAKNFLFAECYFNSARHFEQVNNYWAMAGELFKSFLKTPNYRNKERLYMLLHPLLPKARSSAPH